MPVRSQRVTAAVTIGAASTLVYTCPAGRTYRGPVTITNQHATAPQFAALAINGGGFAQQFWGSQIPQKSSLALNPVILNPGDALYAWIEGGSAGKVILMGSLLFGAPQ